jgi:NlpC/P60 family putative phage cell wall peptidase
MTEPAASASDDRTGAEVVALAREWIGTPYRHQSSCRGAGTDCLGLLRGLWREVLGPEPESVPAYSTDWSEPSGSEDLLAAAARHLVPVTAGESRAGDIVVMRMRDGGVAKHVGVLAQSAQGHQTLIHAYSGHGVVESPLTPAWARRIAGTFRFPERTR